MLAHGNRPHNCPCAVLARHLARVPRLAMWMCGWRPPAKRPVIGSLLGGHVPEIAHAADSRLPVSRQIGSRIGHLAPWCASLRFSGSRITVVPCSRA